MHYGIKRKKSYKKPYLIAITGSFGTGKSFVGSFLKNIGLLVLDTDDIVRKILSKKNKITKRIVKAFHGKGIVSNSKYFIDRNKLSKIVFNDATKRKKLESILHPEVRKEITKLITVNKNKKIIVVLIPLLYESGQEKMYNECWCVICKENIQLKRLVKKGFKKSDALSRIKAQLPQAKKAKMSDFVIDNSGTVKSTKLQVLERLKSLRRFY